jgi:hypothetical protein
MLWCLLLAYCKQVYATYFDLYLGHHQANCMKHKLSYMNLVTTLCNFCSYDYCRIHLKNANNM